MESFMSQVGGLERGGEVNEDCYEVSTMELRRQQAKRKLQRIDENTKEKQWENQLLHI